MNVKIAIKSCHQHVRRRDAQRATWLRELNEDFFFVVGGESTQENDVLHCNVSDAFSDIAPKVLCACKYALEDNVTHLFVCDDDTYVRPDRLLKSGFRKHDYIGHLRVDNLFYNQGVPYAQGSAYWLSELAMECVVRHGELMRPGVIDDGAVGRCLIDRVAFTHDYRYEPGPNCMDRRPMPDNNVITTHKCLPGQMHYAHEIWAKPETQPRIL